ncbi:uncharacterized protein TNCT_72671 [Trichonephila clavata]|uniref:Uncharacterized protein n=1 Tax=Trichonephila clavata TaxID=2740835 RepID=A0A8X6H7J4_TRICU|nr:uncharacterized protein TNCT_72671 [Trichonephila clavata]
MACEDKTEEMHFVSLFEETLERNRGHISDDDIYISLMNIIKSFIGKIEMKINNYQTPEMAWAYFFRFSPISAALARAQVLEAVRSSEEFRSFFKRHSLEVLSVGSGPGSDLIGLCSALHDNSDFQKLRLTLVDKNEHWQSLFEAMIQVTRCGDYGNASRLFKVKEINSSFICCDVLNTATYCGALGNADIVWMKGLLSILENDEERYLAIKVMDYNCMV